MAITYLSLGSNIGDRQKYLEIAKKGIREQIGKIIIESGIYETEPWGFESEDIFLNSVISVETMLDPSEILEIINKIETDCGRKRSHGHYISRTIDIDILFYDQLIIYQAELEIPHPLLHQRRFILIPLNEINPELIHPVNGKKIELLLKECEDKSEVRRFLF